MKGHLLFLNTIYREKVSQNEATLIKIKERSYLGASKIPYSWKCFLINQPLMNPYHSAIMRLAITKSSLLIPVQTWLWFSNLSSLTKLWWPLNLNHQLFVLKQTKFVYFRSLLRAFSLRNVQNRFLFEA